MSIEALASLREILTPFSEETEWRKGCTWSRGSFGELEWYLLELLWRWCLMRRFMAELVDLLWLRPWHVGTRKERMPDKEVESFVLWRRVGENVEWEKEQKRNGY